jgi:integrase
VKRVTIHREVSDIRAILRWAVRMKLIAANPMEGHEMPSLDNARIRPPSKAEIEALLRHAVPHLQRAILISHNTGLRPGKEELFSLTWEAVDFIGGTITVTSAQKGGLVERTVPLSASFVATLAQWYDEDEKSGTRYLVHYNGAKVDSLKHAWANTKKRARITRRLRLYDIRHAFATTLLERGADLKTVSSILGHKSPLMTMQVYQHVSGDLKRRVISLLDEVGWTPPKETDTQPA